MKVNIGRYPKGSGSRRVSVEVDPFDTWSLDHTLALIILPALIQLKHTKHGVPTDFVDDMSEGRHGQYSFEFLKEDADEVFQKGCDNWEKIFDKMIWSFQQLALDDYSDQYHHGDINIGWKKTNLFMNREIMTDENPEEHWYDYVGHMKHEERIQEGLDLFSKYYRTLWD
jgi:hypothetical protein